MAELRFVTYSFFVGKEPWDVRWNSPDKYGNRSVSVMQHNTRWHFTVRSDKPTEKSSAALVKRGIAERDEYRAEKKQGL